MITMQNKGKDFIDKTVDFFVRFSLNQWLLVAVAVIMLLLWAVSDTFTLGLAIILALITGWLGFSMSEKKHQDKDKKEKVEWVNVK